MLFIDSVTVSGPFPTINESKGTLTVCLPNLILADIYSTFDTFKQSALKLHEVLLFLMYDDILFENL